MDAIRLARGVTKREKLVKVEGGYHGHHDEVMISNKPPVAAAGPADAPWSVPQSAGITQGTIDDVIVIPYNDAPALERALASREVACFIVEPVMENIGICLPQPGYLEAVREICTKYGTLLIFDEVKTGLTAGWGGATKKLGVTPDLVTLAKSIGGGFPVGAFGGKAEYMGLITTGEVLHLGTYNGNPLVMAAAKATLTEACTAEAIDAAVALQPSPRPRLPGDHRRCRSSGAHGRVRCEGLHHLVGRTGQELPRLQGDRLRSGLCAVDARHQPWHPPAAGPGRAVAHLGDAHRGRRHALRRRVR